MAGVAAQKPCVLVVDDEPDLRELLCISLDEMDLAAVSEADLAGAGGASQASAWTSCSPTCACPTATASN